MPETAGEPTAFHDLSAFLATPRVTSLTLSPDGRRLVAAVQGLAADGTRRVSALWDIDPAAQREPVRLTRSRAGESAPAFAADGTVYFLSERDDNGPAGAKGDAGGHGVWALPEHGEARLTVRHPGGVTGFGVARDAGALVYTAGLLPGATDAASHGKLRDARAGAGVTAILYESGMTRFWDSDLGPDEPHTFVRGAREGGRAPGGDDAPVVDAGAQGFVVESEPALSPDGTRVAYARFVHGHVPDGNRTVVVVADAATGEELHLVDRDGYQYSAPLFTADGAAVLCVRELMATYERPFSSTLVRIALPGGAESDLLAECDHWPLEALPSPRPDDETLWFTADELGHAPVFRRDPDGTVTRLTASGAYTSLCVAPDGRTLYALRSAVDAPPAPVRLDAAAPDQEPVALKAPGGVGRLPGTLTEVHTTGDDGFPLRSWLVLPEGARAGRPAPLIVFPHGGPQSSWNSWTWRWNPWPFAARGYAVLLPDPALSTGYGPRMHERGWGQWGGRPYRDLMAMTDTAEARPDIDATRTGLAGASYGGYMANWIATRTDRFRAIVSQAAPWELRSWQGDADASMYFRRIFGDPLTTPERYEQDTPALAADRIRTPMLVVHGGKDYRVPVGQGMALFQDLQRLGVPVKFLHFPDEGHWILGPGHARLWYAALLNFFDHHVLGAPWRRPELL
ncbi:S9 family peptidase [Streptomyces sp. NBC_00083]|uniref:S9 family peptidase n=1 Tax=Streptomyces sp. NBC_00083 TaxID=2975647 RepID=UPI0022550FF9|nr:S9 family peptidase [Streptomyces sp. NBC_00083]MCX5386891.1 S9 family peptidase [Streptomyces sp. NBC_00083]